MTHESCYDTPPMNIPKEEFHSHAHLMHAEKADMDGLKKHGPQPSMSLLSIGADSQHILLVIFSTISNRKDTAAISS